MNSVLQTCLLQDVMSFVRILHVHYVRQIVTELEFVFATVALHLETVGGAKIYKMPIST